MSHWNRTETEDIDSYRKHVCKRLSHWNRTETEDIDSYKKHVCKSCYPEIEPLDWRHR